MAATAQVRTWYPEGVVGYTSSGNPVCNHKLRPNGPAVQVSFPSIITSASHIPLKVHWKQEEAWEAFIMVMETLGVHIGSGASGTANCRDIGMEPDHREDSSLHAHLSAFDLLPMAVQTPRFVGAVQRIRAKGSTEAVFLNGAGFTPVDPFHWQINVPPATLAAGIDWTTVLGFQPPEDEMTPEAEEFFQAMYDDFQALKNPDGTTNPAKPTSMGYVLREYRRRADVLNVGGNEPEKVADKTLEA